jgi:putative transposase
MVEVPNPPATRKTPTQMQSITLAPEKRKDLIRRMKRERRPSSRLRMHIVLLAADGYSPTQIAHVLFCSRTTIYSIVGRFAEEGRAAFEDRSRRGPRRLVLDGLAHKRIEELTQEGWPPTYGWLRSRWSCSLLALQLLRERGMAVSRETVRRALHHLGFRWRRPRPVPPPEDSKQKRKRLRDILLMLHPEKACREGSFFQDETKLETNPRVGFCWMRKGEQRRLPTPGKSRKVWISGALNFSTGRFYWVSGPNKNSELFLKLLKGLRRAYRCYRRLHLAVDNDASHTSKEVEEYLKASEQRLCLHPLPARSPQSNPVELIWWGLHEAVSRNHRCKDLTDLLEFAEHYLEERQPFHMRLGKDYRQLERASP